MFQFPGLPHSVLFIQTGVVGHNSNGVAPFGHPRISACNGSPWLFAVYCVLLRLLTPRYPPCALCSFSLISGVLHAGQDWLFAARLQTTIGGIRTSICSFQGTQPVLNGLSAGHQDCTGWCAPGISYLIRFTASSAQIVCEFFFNLKGCRIA